MLKVEAIIEEVVNGDVTQLRIGDDVYAIQYIGCYTDIVEADVKNIKQEENVTDRGEIIEYIGNCPVYSNIFKEILENIGFQYDKETYRKILRKYYPNATKNTIKVYTSVYKRYIEREFNVNQDKKTNTKTSRRRIRKPKNALSRSKTYKRWVTKEEYQNVKISLHTFGIKPTTKFIMKDTGYSSGIVRSVLAYMKKKEQLKSYTDEDGKRYYSFVG